ncbi:MAG: V-type ATPase subunit [Candidatus Anstonellaceae archaeon]
MLNLNIKIQSRPLVYGYSNARAHAMFSKLLTSQQLLELASMPSTTTIAEALNRTDYKEDILKLSLYYRGEQLIDFALSENFARFCKKLYKITPNSDKKIIFAILSRWDSHNIKTLILGRKQQKSWNDIRPYLVPAGSFSIEDLEKLYNSKDVLEFYSQFKQTEFGQGFINSKIPLLTKPLKEAFKAMDSNSFISEMLILSLDFYQYQILSRIVEEYRNEKNLAQFLSSFTDQKNLEIILRLSKENIEEEKIKEYLLPGGKISSNRWLKAAAKKDVYSIISSLADILPLKEILEEVKKTTKLSEIEKLISIEFSKKRLKLFRGANLSIAVLVAALFFKEQEVENIRKILRGKQYGFSEEELKKLILLY